MKFFFNEPIVDSFFHIYFSAKESFTYARSLITIKNYLYITGDFNVWKKDEQLNVLITHTNSIAGYRGLYYNSTDDLIYMAS
jgi:hypothetical protein